jgi:hypothetical protein
MHLRSRVTLGLAATAALLVSLAGCGDGLPGTTLGTYKVTAQSQTNTCGLAAPDPWAFDAELSQDGTLLYWSWMDGSPYVSGPVTAQAATLLATEQANVDGTADGGLGPCSLERDDTLALALANGSPPPTFTGSISYAITPTSGSACGDQLAGAGGQYSALPCTITYTMTASRQ